MIKIIFSAVIALVSSSAFAENFQFKFESGIYKSASGCRFIVDQTGWTMREISLWNVRDDHDRRDCSAIAFQVKPSDVAQRTNGVYVFNRNGNHMTLKVNEMGEPVSIEMKDGVQRGTCKGKMSYEPWPSEFDRGCKDER